MRISDPECQVLADELDLLGEYLPLDGARVLELGCGAARMTRRIVERFPVAALLATEVDEIQHARNLAATPLPGVTFVRGGAQHIPADAGEFDVVLMFKSLHHVPRLSLDAALGEIARVLRPGGLAWLSEPVYAGDYNDIMRLFHDEKAVREAAFAAIGRAVVQGRFDSVQQFFFLNEIRFDDFATFEQGVLGVTHTEHRLDDALLATVRQRFERHLGAGGARFEVPMRVDLLRKP